MNTLTIPPSPNWYENSILCCTTDNTVVYGARNELVVIQSKDPNKPADIKFIPYAHREKVVSVDANRSWGDPNKYVVSSSEDKIIKLWDIECYNLKLSHYGHTTHDDRVVSAKFAGNNKVVSVSENGFVILWRIDVNELTEIQHLFGPKNKVTCLSICPHASWIAAFGLKNGSIIITDLRKSGRILHRLKGHDKSIVSLSWCPAPYNVLEKKGNEIKTYTDKIPPGENSQNYNIKQTSQIEDEINEETTLLQAENNLTDDDATEENITENVPFKEKCASEVQHQEILPVCKKDDIKGGNTNDLKAFINEQDTGETSKQLNIEENKANTNENIESESVNNVNEHLNKGSAFLTKNEGAPKREYLLVSSAREGSIIIWRASNEGRVYHKLQQSKSHGNKKYRNNANNKMWVSLCWVKPDVILSSQDGDLIQWDLWKSKNNGKYQSKLIHSDHNRCIFCISVPPVLYETIEECMDWKNQSTLAVWTIGQDRYLLNTSLCANRKTLASYPTVGGHVLCFSVSDLDPNKIAIGFGDGTLKLWDLSCPNLQVITMTTVWPKPLNKVTSLAWHPEKEVLLACGISDGRVGLLNTNELSKGPKFLTHYLQSTVHKIEWGPLNGDINNLGLYVVSEGKIVIYNTSKPLEEPAPLNTISTEFITNMSWNQDYTLLAVGLKTGPVMLFTAELKLLTTLYLQKKTIQCLVWHPFATAEDEEMSPYANLLAVASNDNYIAVYDCSDVNGKINGSLLKGHVEAVKCLSWSFHESGKLVSGSEDGTALVWDVPKKTCISTYLMNNLQGVTALTWSPLDADYVILGGKDCSIQVWKISEHPARTDLDIMTMKKNLIKDSKENGTKQIPQQEQSVSDSENKESKPRKVSRTVILNLISTLQRERSPSLLDDCRKLLEYHDQQSATNANACSEQENKEEDTEDDIPTIIKFFGNRTGFSSHLKEQQDEHKAKGRIPCYQNLALWMGDIGDVITEAIGNRKLSPWLISLAPMVSPKLWQEACLAYAGSLSESANADPIETASYFLACHKVEEAIEVLCNATLFREALTIAKCRLLPSDPLINDILKQWASHCIITGNYEIAAQCFIALGQIEEAAKVLSRRTDVKTLKLSAELAERSNNKDLYDAVMFRLNAFKSDKLAKRVKDENEVEAECNEIDLQAEGFKKTENEIEEFVTERKALNSGSENQGNRNKQDRCSLENERMGDILKDDEVAEESSEKKICEEEEL